MIFISIFITIKFTLNQIYLKKKIKKNLIGRSQFTSTKYISNIPNNNMHKIYTENTQNVHRNAKHSNARKKNCFVDKQIE